LGVETTVMVADKQRCYIHTTTSNIPRRLDATGA